MNIGKYHACACLGVINLRLLMEAARKKYFIYFRRITQKLDGAANQGISFRMKLREEERINTLDPKE